MVVWQPRNRLVIFRLSEAEYRRLLAACRRDSARSLSDFVRLAVLEQVSQPGAAAARAGIARLARSIGKLESRVARLLERLERLG
ncbi:MAG: hypothetical protein RMK57_11725 [Bryobacterales bacterium]|nr:hypothetical protein [Bryobacteraceae bacterium]MDW8355189.1 hypothetical protein [Bryobacterales bacterium]